MRILVIDDDPDARTLTLHALGQEFPDAELAEVGGPEALEREKGGAFDILVTDYMLRWSDGFAMYEQVKARSPDLCAVMFTGTGSEELAVRAIKTGFDDYIVKAPQQLRRLSAAVRTAYERRQEHRRLEARGELLLRELYHRLHNNLQIVLGLLRRTAKTLTDPADREKLDELGRRIQAISMVQEEFYRADNLAAVPFADYLRRLASDHAALAPNVELQLKLAPVDVEAPTATPLALIANELLTNAVKHGFPDERPGRIKVALESRASDAVLTVSDDGAGGPEPVAPRLGMELMSGLARQIGAKISYDGVAEGWCAQVVFQP